MGKSVEIKPEDLKAMTDKEVETLFLLVGNELHNREHAKVQKMRL